MALVKDPHNNFDRLKDAQYAEEISSAYSTYSSSNSDKFISSQQTEIFGVPAVKMETIVDRFDSKVSEIETSAVVPLGFSTIRDTFHSLVNVSEEWLASNSIEWAYSAISAAEITDAFKTLPMLLRPNVVGDVTVDFEVLDTSTAQNITEYLIDGNGQGTKTFGFVNGKQEFVKTLDLSVLTQVLAKPARTVNIKLKNATGSGTFWPRFVISTLPTNGEWIYIFDRSVSFGSTVPLGTSLADQATKIAAYWNGLNPTINSSWKATAVAVGNSVEFRIDTTLATEDSGLTNYGLQFYSSTTKVVAKGNILDGFYIHIGTNTLPANERRDTWTAAVGTVDTLVVTIEAHGARPGQISLYTYNPTTKRAAKRSQVPNTMVNGLKEKLEELSTRLKNKGW